MDSTRLEKIKVVVRNQVSVSSELLDPYEGRLNQIQLLIDIISEAQGVSTAAQGFVDFVIDNKISWAEWALSAKAFQNWLKSTHYNYENMSIDGLAELFLEHIEAEEATHS